MTEHLVLVWLIRHPHAKPVEYRVPPGRQRRNSDLSHPRMRRKLAGRIAFKLWGRAAARKPRASSNTAPLRTSEALGLGARRSFGRGLSAQEVLASAFSTTDTLRSDACASTSAWCSECCSPFPGSAPAVWVSWRVGLESAVVQERDRFRRRPRVSAASSSLSPPCSGRSSTIRTAHGRCRHTGPEQPAASGPA